MDKSYVSLATCPICKEDNGTILLDRRLKPTFEMKTPTLDPCDTCRKKYLTAGTLLFGKTDEKSPEVLGLAVIKDKAFIKMFDRQPPKNKIVFCDINILRRITGETN